jgi:hypothetical protein
MQIMFLMYHYFAEKEIYNAIRVYIAAYVFMTGYGNWSLYIRGKSFTLKRNLQMLFRLNLFGFVICVALNNEYLLYYICGMHTLFTVLVILALYVRHSLNGSRAVLYLKIALTALGTLLLYDGPDIVFRAVFGTLPVIRQLFAFHDPLHPEFTNELHEWHFRSGLDRFIWIAGMVCAMHFVYFDSFIEWLETKSFGSRLVWQVALALVLLVVVLGWGHVFFMREKFAYNAVHPYTSFVPIVAYMLARNLCAPLRRRYLFLFAYLGRVTLETYILQFHIWMKTTGNNGSPKHLLQVIPGMYFPNLALCSVAYLFISVRISTITNTLKDALIPEDRCNLMLCWTGILGAGVICWASTYMIMGSR